MKKNLLAIALVFAGINSFAQITVTDSDLMSIGDVIYQGYDESPSSSISLGNAGPNQTWDFSALQSQEYDTTNFIDPIGTPFAAIHPTANLCIDDNGEYIYINKSAQNISLVGFDNYPYPIMLAPLPLVYGLDTSMGSVLIMDSIIENIGLIDDVLAPIISLNPLYDKVDSIRIFMQSNTEFNVDAYGNVIIPMGSFDALRVKTENVTTQDIFLYCSSTITGNGSWHIMPDSEVETTSSYAWWTNDPLIKFVLVQMEIDSLGEIDVVDFMHSPAPSSVRDLSTNSFNIFPIPATNNLNIEAKNNELTSLDLLDLNGKLILKKEFINSIILDVSHIAKGMYYLNLKTDEGKVTKKIIIK